jgi:hypothetical protein
LIHRIPSTRAFFAPRIGCADRGSDMSQSHHDDPNEPVPWLQKLLDNPFMLLFLGVMIPMVVYNLWGVVEILLIPVSK